MSFSRLHRIHFIILLEACLCFHVYSVEVEPRVLGHFCNATLYPYTVSILYWRLECGGTLITEQWVLTAAHCFQREHSIADKLTVKSDFHSASNRVQHRRVKRGVAHKKFNLAKLRNKKAPELRWDIGLLMVDRPFKMTVTLQVIRLPPLGFTKNCKKGMVMGTGVDHVIPYIKTDGSGSLRCAELTIVNKTECKKTYETSVLDDTILCTVEWGGKDACEGDSGGPLVCRKTIIGIVSYGKGCGVPGVASTFTKVESFLEFITNTMKALPPLPRSEAEKESGYSSGYSSKESSWKLLCIIYLFMKYLSWAVLK